MANRTKGRQRCRPFDPFEIPRTEFCFMRRFGLAVAACVLAFSIAPTTAALAQGAATDADVPNTLRHLDALPDRSVAPPRPAGRYFIEFRSRSALSYGHTFVVFGRVGEKLTGKNVA